MATVTNTYPDADRVYRTLAKTSKEFADGARHIAAACRTGILDIVIAIEKSDLPSAGELIAGLAESQAVASITAGLEKLSTAVADLKATLSELAPWVQVIIGLVAIPAGYFAVKGFLGALIVIAGIAIAYAGIMKVIAKKT
jgi:hypothetical protein